MTLCACHPHPQRDTIRKQIIDHREVIRKLRDDFNERRKEWQLYLKQQKEAKYREWMERKAQRQAEYEAQKKAFEEEEAKRDPWEEEKVICEQLIVFVEKYLPKKEEVRRAQCVEGVEGVQGVPPLQTGAHARRLWCACVRGFLRA